MEEGSSLEIQLTSQARADLLSIWHYSAERFGEKRAEAYANLIFESLQLLSENPGLGRAVEGFPEVKRFLVKKRPNSFGHHLFYRVRGRVLEVVLIVHSAQYWSKVVEKKLK